MPDDEDRWVSGLFSGLRADLGPDARRGPDPSMPPEVWARIESALAEEQSQDRVVHLIPRLGRGRSRVLGALVAAAALGIIGGLLISQSRSDVDVVAGAPEARLAAPEAVMAEASSAVVQQSSILPVRQLLQSGTAYSSSGMDQQLAALATRAGLRSGVNVADMEQQSGDMTVDGYGFTSSMDALSGCIQALTGDASVPALVIDIAKFDGANVALVLTPTQADSVIITSVTVWIVDPQCASPRRIQTWDLPR
jgi:hypothetical protein